MLHPTPLLGARRVCPARLRPRVVLCLVALAALLAWGCRGPSGTDGAVATGAGASGASARGDRPPIVIVSIDTLRSDHLPVYGYGGVATPALDALRRDAVLFAQAFTPAPLTLPAHASLMTGLLPPQHGVRDNSGYRLGPEVSTLAELLRQHGYRCGGFVSAFVLREGTGIGSGFEVWDDDVGTATRSTMADLQRPGPETLSAALAWLAAVRDEPFFLFLHLYEPHTPWSPPEPAASRYGATYDGEIAAADDVVQALIDRLRELDLYDRSALIVLSDHGEGLLDHGEAEHGVLLYREALQVPLLLKHPDGDQAGSSVEAPVQLTDVTATVLELAGAERPAGLVGSSLLEPERIAGERPLYAETVYPELRLGWSRMLSIVEGRHHYLEASDARPPAPELYDLIADPGEARNRVADDAAAAERLGRQARDLFVPAAVPSSLDAKERQALEALGYLTADAKPASASLLDPRRHVGVLQRLREGVGQLERGEREPAVAVFRAVLAEHPRMLEAWQFLGIALGELDRPGEALDAYGRALDLGGSPAALAPESARLAFRLGRFEEVLAFAELAAKAGAEDPPLRTYRTQALLRLGRPQEALASARAGVERWPDEIELLYQLAAVEMGAGALHDAETHFRRVLELRPDYTPAMGDLAVLLAAQGRQGEARELLERLLELNPNDELARENLRSIERQGRSSS